MRSDEAYKAEVFARRDAVLRVRRRRNRVMLSLLPILCVAGLSVALVLRLPQTTPPKETADGTQTTEATRLAGDNGKTNGAVSDDTADGMDGTDTEGYKFMTAATVLTVTADLSLSPRTVYWADDQKTVIDLAEKGKTVLMVSSEMPELLGVCDRILVMSGGQLAGEVDAATATQEEIMALAAKYA